MWEPARWRVPLPLSMEHTVITTSTVVNSVVEKLRAALARGQWRSGEMLPGQRELAEQLGISRPSLREAVIVLETLGLVRSMPGKGVVVLASMVRRLMPGPPVAYRHRPG